MSIHNKKYIVIEDEEGQESIIVFSTHIVHAHMFEALQRMKFGDMVDWKRRSSHVVGAGFVDYVGNCYGRSESLGVASRPKEDTKLLGISRE